MAVDSASYLVKVDGTEIPNISSYEVNRAKLWTDAGRNLSGAMRATLIGIFPKIELEIAPCTEAEMTVINGLIDTASFTVSWWDSEDQEHKSGTYYASDYKSKLLKKSTGRYDKFKVSLIPYSKMT